MHYLQTDPDTGELVSPDLIVARPDPRTPGEWLLPSGAVLGEPPTVPDGHAARWTGEAWEILEDHRGRAGWIGDHPMQIEDLGPLPEGWSDDPPPLPSAEMTVTPRQIRLALLAHGITPAMVEAQLAGNAAALIEWEYASYVARDHPLVAALGAALGFDEAATDALFAAAAGL